MLKKKYRLKKYSAFIATYNYNNIIYNDKFCIYLGKEKKDSSFPTKYAFVVSKKVSKKAVVRNRIKRLMRESVRLYIKKTGGEYINKYISVIFVAKLNSLNSDFACVDSCLTDLISSNA